MQGLSLVTGSGFEEQTQTLPIRSFVGYYTLLVRLHSRSAIFRLLGDPGFRRRFNPLVPGNSVFCASFFYLGLFAVRLAVRVP